MTKEIERESKTRNWREKLERENRETMSRYRNDNEKSGVRN